jgi:hypothetical protein
MAPRKSAKGKASGKNTKVGTPPAAPKLPSSAPKGNSKSNARKGQPAPTVELRQRPQPTAEQRQLQQQRRLLDSYPGHDKPSTLTSWASAGNASTKEIVFKITDYFDNIDSPPDTGAPTPNYIQYYFDQDQSLIGTPNSGGAGEAVRILKAEFYALTPSVALSSQFGTQSGSPVVLFSVPCRNVAAHYLASSQKSTFIPARSDSKWVHIGTYSNAIFERSDLIPTYSTTASGNQCLGAIATVNPDTFGIAPYLLQFKVVITASQALGVTGTVKGTVLRPASTTTNAFSTPGAAASGDINVSANAVALVNHN